MSQEKQHYVYDGNEVIKTGRTAIRNETRNTSRRTARRVDVLHEIQPANIEDGSWKRWVKKEDLYLIVDEDKESHE